MKRKACLIEAFESDQKSQRKIFEEQVFKKYKEAENMYRNTIWFKSLLDAEKTSLKEDKIRKIHYKFEDDREMVEEYNVDTQVLLRRSWKSNGKLGSEGKWDVEIGDPIPDGVQSVETSEIMECKDQVHYWFI